MANSTDILDELVEKRLDNFNCLRQILLSTPQNSVLWLNSVQVSVEDLSSVGTQNRAKSWLSLALALGGLTRDRELSSDEFVSAAVSAVSGWVRSGRGEGRKDKGQKEHDMNYYAEQTVVGSKTTYCSLEPPFPLHFQTCALALVDVLTFVYKRLMSATHSTSFVDSIVHFDALLSKYIVSPLATALTSRAAARVSADLDLLLVPNGFR